MPDEKTENQAQESGQKPCFKHAHHTQLKIKKFEGFFLFFVFFVIVKVTDHRTGKLRAVSATGKD